MRQQMSTQVIFLVTLFIAYFLFIFIALFYPEVLNSENDLRKPYTPKSKRGWWYSTTNRIKAFGKQTLQTIEQRIHDWKTRARHRARYKRLRTVAQNIHGRKYGRQWGRSTVRIMAMTTVIMSARQGTFGEHQVTFDTDSGPIGIDNRCSGCISHLSTDFVGELRTCNRAIKGFGGTRTFNVKTGTIVWHWEDDDGKIHKFIIPNSYYVPNGNVRLLSPQHWSKTQKDNKPIKGTGADTVDDRVILYWKQKQHRKTVLLGEKDNVATFHLAPGFNEFDVFCTEAEYDPATEEQNPIIMDPAEVSDDEQQDLEEDDNMSMDESLEVNEPRTFDIDGPSTNEQDMLPRVIQDEEDQQSDNATADLLKHHHNFAHISFQKLQVMA